MYCAVKSNEKPHAMNKLRSFFSPMQIMQVMMTHGFQEEGKKREKKEPKISILKRIIIWEKNHRK